MNKISRGIKENKLISTVIIGVIINLISTGILSLIHISRFYKIY